MDQYYTSNVGTVWYSCRYLLPVHNALILSEKGEGSAKVGV